MSKIIPNSFQTPNFYIDEILAYLSPEETKVLIYMSRRIFGFGKREDRISLTQLSDGNKHDLGTGLSLPAVRNAVRSLESFGIVEVTAENDPRANEGRMYALQLDSERIDIKGLRARYESQQIENAERTEAARKKSSKQPKDPLLSDRPPTVGQKALQSDSRRVVQSDSRTPPTVGLLHNNQRKPVESQREGERARAQGLSPPIGLSDHPAVLLLWQKLKPEQIPSIHTQARIENEVGTKLKQWEQTLDYWIDNNYRPGSYGKMLERFQEVCAGNGRGGRKTEADHNKGGRGQPVL